ncbi:acyl-CoA/acyl-ACP dehydrogenase [Streptomyces sp. NBC_01020]|uniref:acyl-CoA dehydrogenase family protein n=1 Tax=unclassified Streptomyces TaxID=2593676 RepID=UPI0038671BE9|nr:acyl-CoA/acyl-ACP dehydrogenase [Streptomyces sp. NBC_01020]WSX65470.1 acyl-CoA/acyl-ACP dehydrogenase [Streptomyces sp. NBC_00932]
MIPYPLSELTDERAELATTVRKLFERHCDEQQVRARMERREGFDPATHRELAEMIGVFALQVPEEYGGAGFGPGDLLPVFEEAGRALYGGPLLSSTTAAAALTAIGDPQVCARLLPDIAAGRTVATLAGMDGAPSPIAAARDAAGSWTLTGAAEPVLDGADADLLLVPARTGDEVGLFAVATDGLARTPLQGLDMTRRQAVVMLSGTSAEQVAAGPAAEAALRAALDHAALAVAAECLGAARRCLEDAVAYALTRYQFSRPIGGFQAVKHRLASLWARTEAAGVVLRSAVAALDTAGRPEPLDSAHAFIACVDALDGCAEGTIRVHGGIGFTWEHSAHLYFRRARAAQTLLGPLSAHRARVARLAGLDAASAADAQGEPAR